MKVFKKILFILLILGGIIIVAALVIGRVYEDEITQYAVESINRQIKTRVDVANINLSLLKKFPDATLEFEDILVRSVPDFNKEEFSVGTDTLLFADQIYMQFSVLDLLNQQYHLKDLQIRSGMLRILTDSTGGTNYQFWNRREKEEKDMMVELDKVKLSGIHIEYVNHALEMNSRSYVQKASFMGRFLDAEYSMDLGLEGRISEHVKAGMVLVNEQDLMASLSLYITPGLVEIQSGILRLAGQQLHVDGNISREETPFFRLSLKGEQLDLGDIVHYMNSAGNKLPANLSAGGKISFNASILGEGSKTMLPGIEAAFQVRNGQLYSGSRIGEIRDFRTDGTYTNGTLRTLKTSRMTLENTSMQIGHSRIGGNFSFLDLTAPQVNHNIKLELDLSDIQDIMADTSLTELRGKLQAEINAVGKQPSLLKVSKNDLLNSELKVIMRFEDAGFRRKKIICSDLNGEISFDEFLQISTISGTIAENTVSFSGRGDNIKEYLFTDHGNLWLDLDIYSDNVDLGTIFRRRKDSIHAEPEDTVKLPDRIYLKSRFWLDKLHMNEFLAGNVMGDMFYKPGSLEINNLSLSSMEGLIRGEGMLVMQSDQQFLVKVISDLSRVDIRKGFAGFNNFGQDFIMDRHLEGSLTGKVHFSAIFNEKMKIKKESILSECDIIIRDGGLMEFEPMQKLSRFIEVEELENVQFSTLCNQIYIRNQEVMIPRMDIMSSAFDIEGSGFHSFDRNFEYKVKVSLSEILAGNMKKPDRQSEEFGVIEDDGLGRVYLYLIIEGSPEGSSIKYDRRGAIRNVQEQLQEEKTEIRKILNEEFGLFKKDSSLLQQDVREDSPSFIIEWEEERGDDSLRKEELSKDNKSQREGFTIRWEDDEIPDTLIFERKKRRKLFKKR